MRKITYYFLPHVLVRGFARQKRAFRQCAHAQRDGMETNVRLFLCLASQLIWALCQARLTVVEEQLVLDLHNQARRNVNPAGANIQLLVSLVPRAASWQYTVVKLWHYSLCTFNFM
jgi:hypothetical protein